MLRKVLEAANEHQQRSERLRPLEGDEITGLTIPVNHIWKTRKPTNLNFQHLRQQHLKGCYKQIYNNYVILFKQQKK